MTRGFSMCRLFLVRRFARNFAAGRKEGGTVKDEKERD